MRKPAFFLLGVLSCYADEIAFQPRTPTTAPPSKQELEKSPQEGPSPWGYPLNVGLRYTSPKGIGYSSGYTTLEGFFAPSCPWKDRWVPFLDLRGHVFDSGKFAANAGVGFRYLTNKYAFGFNGYYDYRDTKRQHYNQAALGFEFLSNPWDFRINGYLPVGKKTSSRFGTGFYAFEGHHLLLKYKRDFALGGFDTEVGYHLDSIPEAPLYFAAGPYYLTGKGASTWGGQFRASCDLFTYVRLEGNVAYDHFFKWTGQGTIGIQIPFGKKCAKTNCTFPAQALAFQRVYRHEIIPVGKQKVKAFAINPATGDPWFFWFVNNLSGSSLGTFEAPFTTLAAAELASAPNQAIYVFPGDGTTTGLNSGITLKDSQLLLGASVDHPIPTTQGVVVVPPMASTLPHLTNAGNIITLANNNTISGFLLDTTVAAVVEIFGTGIRDVFIDRNTFVDTAGGSQGIWLVNNFSGRAVIDQNTFGNFGNALLLSASPLVERVDMTRNRFDGFVSGNGVFGDVSTRILTLNVSENHFSNFSGNAHVVLLNASTTIVDRLDAFHNTFSDFNVGTGIGLFNGSHIGSLNLSDNTLSNFSASSGIQVGTLSTVSILRASNNTCANFSVVSNLVLTDPGSVVNAMTVSSNYLSNFNNSFGAALSGSTSTVFFSKNIASRFTNGSNGIGIFGTAVIENVIVSQNSFSDFTVNSYGIDKAPAGSNVTSMQVLENTFAGGDTNGYAANIKVNAGTTCLQFIHNFANPVTVPVPYAFSQAGAGVFNRTLGSDNSTNTGDMGISGAVNAPGSCALP